MQLFLSSSNAAFATAASYWCSLHYGDAVSVGTCAGFDVVRMDRVDALVFYFYDHSTGALIAIESVPQHGCQAPSDFVFPTCDAIPLTRVC